MAARLTSAWRAGGVRLTTTSIDSLPRRASSGIAWIPACAARASARAGSASVHATTSTAARAEQPCTYAREMLPQPMRATRAGRTAGITGSASTDRRTGEPVLEQVLRGTADGVDHGAGRVVELHDEPLHAAGVGRCGDRGCGVDHAASD